MRDVGRDLFENRASELIDIVYAAMLGESDWQLFLNRLGEAIPGGKAMLFYHNSASNAGTFALTSGLDAAAVAAYNDYYSRINPWMPKASVRRVGRAVIADEMLPHRELQQTEFYADFLRAADCHSAVGITIERKNGVSFLLSTLTSEFDPDTNMVSARLLSELSPHLQRAFRYLNRDPLDRAPGNLAQTIAGQSGALVFVVGENRHAKHIGGSLRGGTDHDLLWVDSRQRIRSSSADVEAIIEMMLDRSYRGTKSHSLTKKEGSVNIVRVEKDSFTEFFEGPTVVAVLQPRMEIDYSQYVGAFAHSYGLTRAETRAVKGILDGKSIQEIAEAASVSYETIKTQIKSIYSKTGTRQKIDLVRKILGE